MELLSEIQIAKFKSKILPPNEKGCMLWDGCLDKDGYGTKSYRVNKIRVSFRAHRLALWLVEKPSDPNLLVLHKPIVCNNPRCCNVEHLRYGTILDNMADKVLDGTHLLVKRGAEHHNSKLNENKVKEIKQLLTENLSHTLIGKKFGVNRRTITDIALGKTWKHVE